MQHDPDLAADQPDRNRVAVHADRDLAVAVGPWLKHAAGPERVVWQCSQKGLFDGEVVADGAWAGADAALFVLDVPDVDQRVEFIQRGDGRYVL
ncbi:hypothetical protein Are01nite_85200 [Actinoplanes regularis]|nr:hypothetical protein Are01nite_85200 [Actinoplanes regularis]